MEFTWILYLPLVLVLYILTKHFLHKFQNLPPSPIFNLPFLGHLHLLKKPLYRSLATISDRYGPVVFLHFGSRRVLVVSSPSAAEECLNKNDVVFANRPHTLAGKYIGNDYTSLAWSSYGDHWRNLRRISTTEILSTHKLQMLGEIRAEEVRSMIGDLKRASDKQQTVDMKTVFFELMMNVMMRMIVGKRYFSRDAAEEGEEGNRFRKIVADTFRLQLSNMGDFLPVVRWLGIGGVENALVKLQRRRDVFMQELVDECRRSYGGGGGGKRKTMTEMLLALQEKEPEYYSDGLIKSLMLVMLAAGTDTSAGTLEWALSLLLNHPYVLKKAQTEIENHVGNHRQLDESDMAQLPYLRSIIDETLRLYPPGPLLIPHESSQECCVGGYRVPKGTMLLVNVWAIHRDPRNFEDAAEFKPERFERVDGDRDKFKLVPFGFGRRSCPGEGLALRMVGLGLGSLIQCFDWERAGGVMVDMSEGVGLTLPKATPLMAYCRARPFVASLLSEK